jgi:hypothetical protein
MIYLKYFENTLNTNFNIIKRSIKENLSDKNYQEIDKNNWISKSIPFSDNDIEKIYNLCLKYLTKKTKVECILENHDRFIYKIKYSEYKEYDINRINLKIISIKASKTKILSDIYIRKDYDDYYYLYKVNYYVERYYKCDQLSGLFSLLKEIMVDSLSFKHNENMDNSFISISYDSDDNNSLLKNLERTNNIMFNQHDLNSVKKCLNNLDIKTLEIIPQEEIKSTTFKKTDNIDKTKRICISYKTNISKYSEFLFIYKLTDNYYFIVSDFGKVNYKCDQLTGLISCLKNMITND